MGRAWDTHLCGSDHCFPCIGAVITRHEKIVHSYTFSFTGTSSYESRHNTITFSHGSTYYYWFICSYSLYMVHTSTTRVWNPAASSCLLSRHIHTFKVSCFTWRGVPTVYCVEFAKLHPLSSNYKMMNKINFGTKFEYLCSAVFVDVLEFVRQVRSFGYAYY